MCKRLHRIRTALRRCLSLLPVIAISALAFPAATQAESVCFDNPNNYATPYIYMWGANPSSAIPSFTWPGRPMTRNTAGFYCFNTNSSLNSSRVIFNNNGSPQTQDMSFTSPNTCYQGGSWKAVKYCGLNVPPVANAGADITINQGDRANFNASASSDADGTITQYQWSNGLTGATPSMVYNDAGTFTVTLTVRDDVGATATDTVVVRVNAVQHNVNATAICFNNPNGYTNPHVHLWNGAPAGRLTDTTWPGRPMTRLGAYYCYDPAVVLTSVSVIFNNGGQPQTANLSAAFPNSCYQSGTWRSLQTCGFNVINVIPVNQAPVANAGADITVVEGSSVQFNGAGSSDPDGSIASYSWSNGLSGAAPSMTYNTPGTYNVTLTVTDNAGATATDVVVVTVTARSVYNYPTGKALFYVNNGNWNPPYAYIWGVTPANSTAEMAWPGADMKPFGGMNLWWTPIGQNTTAGYAIFSNQGNNQTQDLQFSGNNLCYNNGQWMTLAACGVPEQITADAGPDRRVNVNTRLALSAAASSGTIAGTTWTSGAWSGPLTGASVVTPTLSTTGTYTVTMTLPNGGVDTFQLTVVPATQGLAERPQLAAPLNFPLSGSVSSGNYDFEPAFPNLNGQFYSPVMVTNDGVNDLIYVVDKAGTITVFANDEGVTLAETTRVLDIRNEVRNYHEQGLLSLAFHPNFATNRYAYIYYIAGANDNESDNGVFGDGVLQRIRFNSASNPTSVTERVEVLRIPQPGPDHKGGMMQFHPTTGHFYMSIGDGAYGDTAIVPTYPDPRTNNSSQETNNLRGSFIRLTMLETPNSQGRYYDIPSDNPFVSNPNVLNEIWSYGHRNPWRWAFDTVAPYTLWETEIGQAGFEEVNIINAGGNYGWPICEGNTHRGSNGGDPSFLRSCTNDLVGPVGGYNHSTGSVSIIGGFVYRGSSLPGIYGQFLYGDYVSKKIWGIAQGQQAVEVSNAFPANISSFGTDVYGESVFVSSHGVEYGGPSTIYRMVDREAQAAVIPANLSQTGIFADLAARIPAHGVIEYSVNSDGWFDGAKARHFIAVPNSATIDFDEEDVWDMPIGTVLVKHLELPTSATATVAFETSVLFRQNSGNWTSANYRWNATRTDATLVESASQVTVNQYLDGSVRSVSRNVLSGAECGSCHTGTGSKEPLGLTTRQLNGDFNYQGLVDNQLDVFDAIDLFSAGIGNANNYVALADPADQNADINDRARAYMDTNCAHCHGGTFMDLRHDTPIGNADIMNVERSAGIYRMLPFDHTASLIHTYQVTDANRMPKGTRVTNPLADELFADWIDGLDANRSGMIAKTSAAQLFGGGTATLRAFNLYDNGFEQTPTGSVSWSSSDTNVVRLSSTSGSSVVATGIGSGQATISLSSGGYSGSINLAVGAGPDAPSGFTATALSTTSIRLDWVDNADDEDSYVVSRSTSANGPFADILTLAANARSVVDSALTPDTRYYYRVLARNSEGDSVAASANARTLEQSGVDSLRIVSLNGLSLINGETYQLVAIATASGESIASTHAASWSSSNSAVVSVSASGLLTGGTTAGTAVITANVEGVTATVSVINEGRAQYVYFNKPGTWTNPTAYVWTNQNGTVTPRNGAWPGGAITKVATRFGGTWLRLTIPQAWANTSGNTHIIFSNAGATQTENLTVAQANPSYYNNGWLTQAPLGDGVETGSQIQIGNGSVTLSGSANLSGKLFVPGTVLNVSANAAGPGMTFTGWEGTGAVYLVDPTAENTQIAVGSGLSYTLLAVFDSVEDGHVVGRQYYQNQGCVGCHGADGTSGTSLVNVPDEYTLASLTTYIENFMPMGNAAACRGECASTIAAMIMDNAYSAPAGVCDATSLDDLVPQDRNFRLLSTLEYNNSVRDLLGLSGTVDVTTGRIPADIPVNGFKTNANTVFTNDYAKGYILAAEAAAGLVSNIYSLAPGCGNISCVIQSFGKRAYRRPLTSAEVSDLVNVHNTYGDLGLLSSILSSPNMLYRSEVGVANGSGYYELTDYEVASMLSYTYWATTPDATLMAAADAGQLSTPAQISARVQQMLQDPRAQAAFERFITGWLDLDKEIKSPDLSDALKADMKQETIEFVRRTVFGSGTYDDLLTADYSFMTQRLATHYGLPWPGGSGWQQVSYSGVNAERRGVLGHAGILAIQSASEKTHPVKRGLFVRRSLMCQDFPPPPVGAALKPQEDPSLTVRERFEHAHLQEGCESCHQYIDGIGFGLENYNAYGNYVTTETTDDGQVKPINALGYIGSLNSAETFLSESEPVVDYHGMDELAELIAGSSNGRACYARQWYRYTRGQREEVADSCTLQVFGETFKSQPNTTMLDLMVQFTQTRNYILRK